MTSTEINAALREWYETDSWDDLRDVAARLCISEQTARRRLASQGIVLIDRDDFAPDIEVDDTNDRIRAWVKGGRETTAKDFAAEINLKVPALHQRVVRLGLSSRGVDE